MCQLLGVSSNKDVDIQFSLREFRHRGETNPHGWGFAFWEKGGWKVIKQPHALIDEDIKNQQFQFKSKTIIGHVRLKSCGRKAHQNTHPFHISNWVFAHNGTLHDIKQKIQLQKYQPEGETDSEYAFCYLLEKIAQATGNALRKAIEEETAKLKALGNFNFLLSDGDILYAHGDNSLYFVERKAPFAEVTLRDDDYTVSLSEIKEPDERAVIIATEPLTKEENWIKFKGLKLFRNGEEIV